MSWTIIPEFRLPDEPEALDYIAAVEEADGQELEPAVKLAYNTFIKGCKADGIWNAIKASCILAGARTLAGALVPLVGTAPTSYNFVAGDYNRETGLAGNGTNNYLNSNRANGTDPRDNLHVAAYVYTVATANGGIISSTGALGTDPGTILIGQFPTVPNSGFRNHSGSTFTTSVIATGLLGSSRSSGSNFVVRNNGVSTTALIASDGTGSGLGGIEVFRRDIAGFTNYFNGRLSFYSIGESLDLALLDARVTTLMSDLAAAIP